MARGGKRAVIVAREESCAQAVWQQCATPERRFRVQRTTSHGNDKIWAPISANKGTHMKTTIDLPDALFSQARRYAGAHNMTMKSLIAQGLRNVMTEKKTEPKFKLRDGSVNGNGMTPEYQNATWEEKLEIIYEGRT
jgi:hypothetical protein